MTHVQSLLEQAEHARRIAKCAGPELFKFLEEMARQFEREAAELMASFGDGLQPA